LKEQREFSFFGSPLVLFCALWGQSIPKRGKVAQNWSRERGESEREREIKRERRRETLSLSLRSCMILLDILQSLLLEKEKFFSVDFNA